MTPKTSSKTTLEQALLCRGLAETKAKSRSLILAGLVVVNDQRVDKCGALVKDSDSIRLKQAKEPLRGSIKLQGAIDHYKLDDRIQGCHVIDVGSSSGGFTQVMLERGAQSVCCVDVGSNQLIYELRVDPRVKVFENTDIRNWQASKELSYTLLTADISFKGLVPLLPAIVACSEPSYPELLLLVKPQFELASDLVGEGGIVHKEAMQQQAVDAVAGKLMELSYSVQSPYASPLKGRKGNQEYFLLARRI